MFTEEIKTFSQEKAIPKEGCFAADSYTNVKWLQCRETFGVKFTVQSKGLFFSHNGQDENLALFLNKIERILDVEPTSFSKTNKNWAIWVSPSKFWKECPMRQSLLTILLRAGLKYDVDIDNFNDSLFEYEYVKLTKKAVMRFLYGFTKFIDEEEAFGYSRFYKGSERGWVTMFESKTLGEITKQLVSPDNVVKESCLIGTGRLWT